MKVKKLLAIMITLIMIIGLFPAVGFAADPVPWDDKPSGVTGSGTESDPYCLGNADHLSALADKVNGGTAFEDTYFKLADSYNDTTALTKCIGQGSHPFSGHFDGNFKTVYLNFSINMCYNYGFIGELQGSISNLTVTGNFDALNSEFVAAVCGENSGGTITNCISATNIDGNSDDVGGICGENLGTITNCMNTGSVHGTFCTAGICGYNRAVIVNCVNTGAISRNIDPFLQSYYIGAISPINDGTITNCYFDKETSGEQHPEATGTGLSTAQMKAESGTDGALIDQLNKYIDEHPDDTKDWSRWEKAAGDYPHLPSNTNGAIKRPDPKQQTEEKEKEASEQPKSASDSTAGKTVVKNNVQTGISNDASALPAALGCLGLTLFGSGVIIAKKRKAKQH